MGNNLETPQLFDVTLANACYDLLRDFSGEVYIKWNHRYVSRTIRMRLPVSTSRDYGSIISDGASIAGGLMYCVSGAAKVLTTSDPNSLLRKLLARSGFTDQFSVRAAEQALGTTELAVGLGQLFHSKSRIVRSGSMILSISALASIEYGVRREPAASCGCFGNLSQSMVKESRLRSAFMVAIALMAIRTNPCRVDDNVPWNFVIAKCVAAAGLTTILWKLSPEAKELNRAIDRRVMRKRLSKKDPASNFLMRSHSWDTLQPHIDRTVEPDYWLENDTVLFAFRANATTRHLSVLFQGKQNSEGVRFLGALIDDDTGAVLVVANG